MPLCMLLCGPKIRNKDLVFLYMVLEIFSLEEDHLLSNFMNRYGFRARPLYE